MSRISPRRELRDLVLNISLGAEQEAAELRQTIAEHGAEIVWLKSEIALLSGRVARLEERLDEALAENAKLRGSTHVKQALHDAHKISDYAILNSTCITPEKRVLPQGGLIR